MYMGVVAILAYFTVTPVLCELGVYLYSKGGNKH